MKNPSAPRRNSLGLLTLCSALSSLSMSGAPVSLAHADDLSKSSALDPIVVTATRTPQSLTNIIPSVTVISREDIERTQAVTIEDLLMGQPGVEINRTGGIGAQRSFFMRGQDANSLAIYVDGVRVQTDGYANLQTGALPPPQLIDHIEILRGNAGALYGESATGGVIDIHTRVGSQGDPKAYSTVTLGSQNTIDTLLGYGGRMNDTTFNLSVSEMRTHGIAPLNSVQAPILNLAGNSNGIGDPSNPNAGPAQVQTVNASLSHDFGQGLVVGLTEQYAYSNDQYDDGYGPSNDSFNTYRQNNLTAFAKYLITSDWSTQLDLTRSDFHFQNTESLSPFGGCDYTNTSATNLLKWSNIYKWGAQKTLNFGLDYSSQKFNDGLNAQTPGTFLNDTRQSDAGYVGYSQRWHDFEFQANLRHDDLKVSQQMSGNIAQKYAVNTGLLGAGYWFNPHLKLTALDSSGFRAPAVQELYGYSGNPNLLPQTTHSTEAGLELVESWGYLRAVRFESQTKNYITYNPVPPYASINVPRVTNQGWEFSSRYAFGGLKFLAAYTLQNPKDENGATLPLRAKNFGSVEIDQSFGSNGRYDVGSKVTQSGSRTDGAHPDLAPYTLWSVYAGMKLDEEFKLRLRVDNALNEKYQLSYGYNTPGTTVWLTLMYQQK